MAHITKEGFVYMDTENPIPEPKWWIDELFQEEALMLITAQPGVGKGAFAVELAHAVATGSEFFGRPVPQGTVLYIAGERDRQAANRVFELFGRNVYNFILLSPIRGDMGPINFNVRGDPQRLLQKIQSLAISPSLIVIDTLSNFYVGGQNDDALMLEWVNGVKYVANALGSQVLIVHHDTKTYNDANGSVSGGGSASGSGQLLRAVDHHIKATRDYKYQDFQLVLYEMVMSNHGGFFKEYRVVNKFLEDPEPYLEAHANKRNFLFDLTYAALEGKALSTTEWQEAIKQSPNFGKNHALSVQKFNKFRDQLVNSGKVVTSQDPRRANSTLYKWA